MSNSSAAQPSPGSLFARLRFSPQLRELLYMMVQRVHAAHATVPEERSVPAGPPDPELQVAWAEGLRERDENDTRALMALVINGRFGMADVPLSVSTAEAVARASVRVRLYLRETVLRNLSSEQVNGDLDIYSLPPAEQQGYASFRLLAHLEEDLILQLDPGLQKS